MIPNISFIIPAYNEEKRILQCINSIRSEVFRYNTHWEIIVVDNNSTDWTAVTASRAGAIVIKEEKKGVVWARQAGANIAKYELLAFIDADAIMPKNWIAATIKHFFDDTVVGASGRLRFYDVPDYINKVNKYLYYPLAMFLHHYYPTMQGGNFVIRKSAFEKMGGFDTSIEFWGEDTMTAIKLSKIGRIILDPQMEINTSGRRLIQDGIFKTTFLYVINYFSVNIIKCPITKEYKNFR